MKLHKLDNGLRVFILEKHSVPAVSVQVWYQTGSVQERDGIRGIAHLFEHMMFRGSDNYEPEEHSRLIHDVGGECNAFTTEHATVYFETLPSQHLELALELEADRMQSLRLNQEILDTERQGVLEEFHRYLNDPFARAFFEFRRKLYAKHPYRWTPLGELDDLAKISVEDCENFYRNFYAPNNAAIILSGDIESETALGLVEKHFSSIEPSQADRVDYPAEPEQSQSQHIEMKLPIEVPIVAVAFRAPDASHPDIPALSILDHILASGRSARLEERIVKKRPIAVHAGGHLIVNKDPGMYACFAAYLPNRRSKKVVEAILAEVKCIQSEGVTEDELQSAKNRLLSSKVFGHYSAESLANEIGWSEFIEGDYRRSETVDERIDRVTLDDVQRVARQYLVQDRMTILSVKPEKFRILYWFAGLFYALKR